MNHMDRPSFVEVIVRAKNNEKNSKKSLHIKNLYGIVILVLIFEHIK